MKVGIDISQVAFPGTGVAVYTTNLVQHLLKSGGDYVLFGSSLRQQRAFEIFPQTKVFPFPPTMLEFVWNRLHTLPIESLIGKIDIFHSSDWTQPPTRAVKVTTIHDLVVYKYPETSHPYIVAVQRRRLNWVKKECDKIIAVSESTKKDIVEILHIPANKVKVIYEAINMKKGAVKKQRKPYILVVGTQEPRKNIGRLIQAFQEVKNKDVDLVIVGKYGWGPSTSLRVKDEKVKLLGYVPDEELADLYTNASVFVFPSLYEGFGIPVLEAFNCDCPVVTSNISSLPEIGGQAAVYIDPLSIDDIAEKIDFVLSLSSSKRTEIIKAGREQSQKFSWEKAAAETKKIYEELA